VTFRRSLAIGLLPLATLASGCASTTSSPATTGHAPDGVVSGVAAPCEGPYMPSAQYEAIPVRVQLLKDIRVVAVQTVTGSHTFRFTAPPGEYVVKSNQSATSPSHISITSGATTTTNIYSACS
jgi:hypothetical protein